MAPETRLVVRSCSLPTESSRPRNQRRFAAQQEWNETATTAAINGSQNRNGQTRFAPPTIFLFVSGNRNLHCNAFGIGRLIRALGAPRIRASFFIDQHPPKHMRGPRDQSQPTLLKLW